MGPLILKNIYCQEIPFKTSVRLKPDTLVWMTFAITKVIF